MFLALIVLAYNVLELVLSFLGLDLFADYITWKKVVLQIIWDSAGGCLDHPCSEHQT
jgi:hypothetical protein